MPARPAHPATSMKIPKADVTAVERFQGLVPTRPEVSVKQVFGNPAAFLRGNMFFGVFHEQIFVRLSEVDRADSTNEAGARAFEPMPGRPMTGYMVLPEKVWADPTAARAWVDKAVRFSLTLPPKLPKKKSA